MSPAVHESIVGHFPDLTLSLGDVGSSG